jgi:hypothetical protein
MKECGQLYYRARISNLLSDFRIILCNVIKYYVSLSSVHCDLFAELQATYQIRKRGKKEKRVIKSPLKVETQPQSDKLPLQDFADKLPPLDLSTELVHNTSSSKKKSAVKRRGIPKAKFRNKVM